MNSSAEQSKPSKRSGPGAPQGDLVFSKFVPTNVFGRIRNFPLSRILIALAFLVPVLAINAAIVFLVIENLPEPWAGWVDIGRYSVTFFALLYVWRRYCAIIEKRDAYELSARGSIPEFVLGVLIALSIVGTTVLALYLSGIYSIDHTNGIQVLVWSFGVYMSGSLMQELIARLIIFRLTEEWLGTWVAVAISAVVFGVAHAANPNQTAMSTLTLVITSFVFIGPFLLTRRVWMVLGVHFGWNFVQTGIFGMANSGIPIPGWITPSIDGPVWLTGGAVGIENSALTVGLALLVSVILFIAVRKRGQVMKPRWMRARVTGVEQR